MPHSLNFATLNQEAGFQAWNDTFAYWLLVLYDPANSFALDAEAAETAMSFQFDVEEQAENIESIAGDPALIPRVFAPVAPVTLALRWSPFPAALQALGTPIHRHMHRGSVLATFTPSLIAEASGSTADAQHFTFLLREVCARATAAKALVMLIGSPGWSYGSQDYLAELPHVQQLMRAFGFIYTLRKPLSAY